MTILGLCEQLDAAVALLVGVRYEVRDERVGYSFAFVRIVHCNALYYVVLQSATGYHLAVVVEHCGVVVHVVDAQCVAFEERFYALALTGCCGVEGLYFHRFKY